MYDKTAVANLALGHLGDRHITDYNGNDTSAEIIRDYYDHAVKCAFEAADWQWAKREVQLQLLPTTPVTRYAYFYQLPPYFARVSLVSEHSSMLPSLDDGQDLWDIVDGKFATDAETVFMHYVATDWSEAQWRSFFAEAVSIKLAALCCPRIIMSETRRQGLEDQFVKTALVNARVTDGQDQPPRPRIVRSQWRRDRFAQGFRTNSRIASE